MVRCFLPLHAEWIGLKLCLVVPSPYWLGTFYTENKACRAARRNHSTKKISCVGLDDDN